MGSKNTSQKKTECCLCLKRKVKPDNTYKGMAIKEVYILFLIFDFFPLNDLTRASQISRGLYWLTGNQLLLFKFQRTPAKNLVLDDKSQTSNPVSKQRQILQSRIKKGKRQGTGIFDKEFQQFKKQMDKKFV